MADVELLPLPLTLRHPSDKDLADHVQTYARACVEANIAPLQAENERLREVLETCLETEERPKVIELARAAIASASQLAKGECHCGTCTCDPNMTPAVRFDLSPAQKEGVIRDHLIRLGWTPPDEHAQQPAAVEGFDEWYDSVDARFWDNRDACNAAFHAGKRAALAQQPAPSAPVGAEDIEALKRLRAALPDVGMNGWRFWAEVLGRVIAALAQRPAATDVVQVPRELINDLLAALQGRRGDLHFRLAALAAQPGEE